MYTPPELKGMNACSLGAQGACAPALTSSWLLFGTEPHKPCTLPGIPLLTPSAVHWGGQSCFRSLILCERALENHTLQTQLLKRGRLCTTLQSNPTARIQQPLKAPSAKINKELLDKGSIPSQPCRGSSQTRFAIDLSCTITFVRLFALSSYAIQFKVSVQSGKVQTIILKLCNKLLELLLHHMLLVILGELLAHANTQILFSQYVIRAHPSHIFPQNFGIRRHHCKH